jgi:hypothetical protein
MQKINLTASNPTEQRILDHLQANASALLAEKINTGKKTISGAVKYAAQEARKMASGSNCICIDDATVFGWIMHFFEEDEVKEPPKEKTKITVIKAGAPAKRQEPNAKRQQPKAKPPTGPIFLELFSMEQLNGVKK